MMMRAISERERFLIEGVAKRLPPQDASQLIEDMNRCSAVDRFPDGAVVLFIIEGYDRPKYEGQHSYPVEIRLSDADGADLTAILFADPNDRLYELEIVRWDLGVLVGPNMESVEFY
ncbi:hypothetical protein [Stenotrophomonas sp. CFBP 13725]|uniref:DUF6984 family protein n=1 Tax=Stenotrophomonas sp. CFBP 13725 TaxID=2775297 RepID=UPI00178650DA|nr:hypothetical protein [Stenotrophomonas sp. CFBP 13725]MBD8634465.1 hypothetical protein [Stenotrophomonas sp. CFBP 13725]